jgi:L-lactate dehydrogenase complex protein LldG
MDRDKILQAIRENTAKTTPLPKPFNSPAEKQDSSLINHFKEILQQAGGDCFEINREEELTTFLNQHFPGATDFRKKETWEQYPPDFPKEKLAQLKTVILEGQFGVAENAAVWLDETRFHHRLVPFIAEELVVCLNAKEIVFDMHEAYSKSGTNTTGFGVFISGPSKTADIEQNLVFGAHGAKKIIVVIYNLLSLKKSIKY